MLKYLVRTALILIFLLPGCGRGEKEFYILSAHDHSFLENDIISFGKKYNYRIKFAYRGDSEIASRISDENNSFNAVWPTHRIWLDIADTRGRLTGDRSIMYTPIVLGVRSGILKEIGLSRSTVSLEDILFSLEKNKITLKVPSTVESGPGAIIGITLLNMLSHIRLPGKDKITAGEGLPDIDAWYNRIIVSLPPPENGKILPVEDAEICMTTEAAIIETNILRKEKGRSPLHVVYPGNGVLIADSPFAFIERGERPVREFFERLQGFLLSKKMQRKIVENGRRSSIENYLKKDSHIFPPAWGIDKNRILRQLRLPEIQKFSRDLKKIMARGKETSRTVILLDFSQSMKNGGKGKLMKAVMARLAGTSLSFGTYAPSEVDTVYVFPFSHLIREEFRSAGEEASSFSRMVSELEKMEPKGATGFYSAVLHGLEKLTDEAQGNERLSVVLITDSSNNTGLSLESFRSEYMEKYRGIPVHAVYFEKGDVNQLEKLTAHTGGTLYNGEKDMDKLFKKIMGYK